MRARRQQNFVVASMRRVLNRGGGSALGSLVSRATGQVGAGTLETDIPLNASNALELYQQLSGAGVGLQAVLSPPKYATHIPGGTAYELDLAAVRALTREWFGGSDNPPVPPATTLPSAPPPGATAQPTSGPTATPGYSATPAPGASPKPTALPTTGTDADASPTAPAVAGLISPPPPGQTTSAPGAPKAAPTGGDLAMVFVLGVAAVGAVAVGLLWRRSRRVPGQRP